MRQNKQPRRPWCCHSNGAAVSHTVMLCSTLHCLLGSSWACRVSRHHLVPVNNQKCNVILKRKLNMTIPKDFPGKLFPSIPLPIWTSAKIKQTGKRTFEFCFVCVCVLTETLYIFYSIVPVFLYGVLCMKKLSWSTKLNVVITRFLSTSLSLALIFSVGLTFACFSLPWPCTMMTLSCMTCSIRRYLISSFLSVLITPSVRAGYDVASPLTWWLSFSGVLLRVRLLTAYLLFIYFFFLQYVWFI